MSNITKAFKELDEEGEITFNEKDLQKLISEKIRKKLSEKDKNQIHKLFIKKLYIDNKDQEFCQTFKECLKTLKDYIKGKDDEKFIRQLYDEYHEEKEEIPPLPEDEDEELKRITSRVGNIKISGEIPPPPEDEEELTRQFEKMKISKTEGKNLLEELSIPYLQKLVRNIGNKDQIKKMEKIKNKKDLIKFILDQFFEKNQKKLEREIANMLDLQEEEEDIAEEESERYEKEKEREEKEKEREKKERKERKEEEEFYDELSQYTIDELLEIIEQNPQKAKVPKVTKGNDRKTKTDLINYIMKYIGPNYEWEELPLPPPEEEEEELPPPPPEEVKCSIKDPDCKDDICDLDNEVCIPYDGQAHETIKNFKVIGSTENINKLKEKLGLKTKKLPEGISIKPGLPPLEEKSIPSPKKLAEQLKEIQPGIPGISQSKKDLKELEKEIAKCLGLIDEEKKG